MGIQNITYQTLVNLVVTYIQNNCYNINSEKFNSLPNYFKSGFNDTAYTGSSNGNYKSHVYISIDSNTAISKISDTVVTTDLTNFLTSAGYNNLNSNIPVKEFIGFFNNIISFCSRYLRFTTSQFSDTSYLIYGDTEEIVVDYTGENDDIIYAKDMNDILNVLQNRLSIVVRCYPVKYTYTFD